MSTYAEDRPYEDAHIPAARAVLLPRVVDIIPASATEDQENVRDLAISAKVPWVALRVREPQFQRRFQDVTLRSKRDTGGITEVAKVRAGHGEWLLYAWSRHTKHEVLREGRPAQFNAWVLVDFGAMRESGLIQQRRTHTSNGDGTYFYSYKLRELHDAECMVDFGGRFLSAA